MIWNAFKKGNRCPQCYGSKKLTIEYCKEYALLNDYKVISNKYINNHTNLKFIHLECGNNFEMLWTNFRYGNQRCPKCFGN
ncbi:hypothetical protein ACI3PL_25525, partial [Lacticaseibacillus paracasei]